MKSKETTSYQLRIIALSTMFIDHLAACVLLPMITAGVVSTEYIVLYQLMRYVGRLAFPLFCFFLTQGMIYSHSKEKYMLRLLILAAVSEPIYDYVCRNGIWDVKYQNVIWELLLGALVIYAFQKLGIVVNPITGERDSSCIKIGNELGIAIAIGITIVAVAVASLLRFDYAITGILLILCLYLLRNKYMPCFVLGTFILFAGTFLDTFISAVGTKKAMQGALGAAAVEMLGAFSILLTFRYFGAKGKNIPKWLSYGFYPLHLLLLAVIRISQLGK